ncbi:MAG TPA: Fic family protein [Solirubrobacteraceae bacterium]|nr:Fic family protein [Solirubrobacteraceae bacterium]
MTTGNQRFSVDAQPEVFFSDSTISDAVRSAVRNEKARRLGPRLYTRNMHEAPEAVARRNWALIAAGYFPGSVMTGRTAMEFAPAADGSVFLIAPTTREVRLPGLRLRPRHGPPPAEGDTSWMGHPIFMSSRPRAFLENLEPSRARGGAASRTLRRDELEAALEEYGRLDPASFHRLRDEARALAPTLGMDAQSVALDELIGTLLGTRDAPLSSSSARARAKGIPFDPARIERFEALGGHLLGTALPALGANSSHDLSVFAFFEAYFSNYIEGTEFTVAEAERIVFRGEVPQQRPADAHDILGTYRLLIDGTERRRVPASADELVELLRRQHHAMLGERPDIGPGQWKQRPNQVGGRLFVAPELVEGTLRESYRIYGSLPAGFARAAFAMFLVSEVHPFADGNGRMARILMNSELTAADEQRIIVRTRDRGDYLAALRGMTNTGNALAYTAVLADLQRSSAAGDNSSLAAAERDLNNRQAFDDPDAGGVDLGRIAR